MCHTPSLSLKQCYCVAENAKSRGRREKWQGRVRFAGELTLQELSVWVWSWIPGSLSLSAGSHLFPHTWAFMEEKSTSCNPRECLNCSGKELSLLVHSLLPLCSFQSTSILHSLLYSWSKRDGGRPLHNSLQCHKKSMLWGQEPCPWKMGIRLYFLRLQKPLNPSTSCWYLQLWGNMSLFPLKLHFLDKNGYGSVALASLLCIRCAIDISQTTLLIGTWMLSLWKPCSCLATFIPIMNFMFWIIYGDH